MSKLTETQSYISELIWALRSDKGWSQQQLADKLKTSRAQICRLENPNECKPNIQTLVNLAKIFRVDLQITFVERD